MTGYYLCKRNLRRFLLLCLLVLLPTYHPWADENSYEMATRAMAENRCYDALRYYQEALAGYSPPADAVSLAEVHCEVGKIFCIFSHHDDGSRHFKEAMRYAGDSSLKRAEIHFFEGINFMLDGDYQKALQSLNEANAYYERHNEIEPQAKVRLETGNLYFAQKKYNKAFQHFERARKILDRRDPSHLKGVIYDSLGEAYRNLKDPQMALTCYRNAIAQADAVSDPALYGRIYFHMGMLFETQGKYDEAIKYYGDSIQASLEPDGTLSAVEKLIEPPDGDIFGRIIPLLIDDERIQEAHYYCQLSKELTELNNLSASYLAIGAGRSDSLSSAIARERELFYQILSLSKRKREEPVIENTVKLGEELAVLKDSHKRISREIQLADPEYYSMIHPEIARLPEILYVLKSDEALIEYFLTGDTIFAWYVDSKIFRCEKMNLSRIELYAFLSHLKEKKNPAIVKKEALSISSRLCAPYENLLQGKRKLIIVPHEELVLFPFSLLSDSGGDNLMNEHEISLAPSASTWVFAPRGLPPGKNLLVICALGGAGSTERRNVATPQSGREGEVIFPLFSPRILIKDRDMRLERVTKNIIRASLIHFATNCFIDESSPIFSGIVLSDGILSCFDLAALDLSSSCAIISQYDNMETADAPGFNFLVRSFLRAGVGQVMVSSFDIPGELRLFFFTELYGNLKKGLTPMESLRLAQVRAMKNYSDTIDWALFSLYARRER